MKIQPMMTNEGMVALWKVIHGGCKYSVKIQHYCGQQYDCIRMYVTNLKDGKVKGSWVMKYGSASILTEKQIQ